METKIHSTVTEFCEILQEIDENSYEYENDEFYSGLEMYDYIQNKTDNFNKFKMQLFIEEFRKFVIKLNIKITVNGNLSPSFTTSINFNIFNQRKNGAECFLGLDKVKNKDVKWEFIERYFGRFYEIKFNEDDSFFELYNKIKTVIEDVRPSFLIAEGRFKNENIANRTVTFELGKQLMSFAKLSEKLYSETLLTETPKQLETNLTPEQRRDVIDKPKIYKHNSKNENYLHDYLNEIRTSFDLTKKITFGAVCLALHKKKIFNANVKFNKLVELLAEYWNIEPPADKHQNKYIDEMNKLILKYNILERKII